jgi:ribonuclease VapC
LIIDSSALLAILNKEPERDRIGAAIGATGARRISAATLLETAIVVEARSGVPGGGDLDELVEKLRLQVVPFTAEHGALAREAFRRYGKGQGHPARLNFGDCFAYALAKATGEPLLFKGGDFAETDISVADY